MKHGLIAILILLGLTARAQDFKHLQSVQESKIKAAHKKVRLSDREYEKLMKEQQAIKDAIARAEEDGIWTAKEKNAVNAKIERAGKRFGKYRRNGEVY